MQHLETKKTTTVVGIGQIQGSTVWKSSSLGTLHTLDGQFNTCTGKMGRMSQLGFSTAGRCDPVARFLPWDAKPAPAALICTSAPCPAPPSPAALCSPLGQLLTPSCMVTQAFICSASRSQLLIWKCWEPHRMNPPAPAQAMCPHGSGKVHALCS